MLNEKWLKMHKTQLIVLALISLFLISAGGLLYHYQARQFKQNKRAELHTINEIKVIQISRWLDERHYDATEIYDSPSVNKYVSEWIKDTSNPALKKTIEQRLKGWLRHGTYHSTMILDPQGNVLASYLDDVRAAGPETRYFAQKVTKARQVLTNEFYRCTSCDVVHMDVMLPVINAKDNKVVAVIVLRVDAEDYLFPLIQLWPVPSKTSSTMLVQRDGDNLINLNDLPGKNGTALTFRFKLSSKSQATIKAFNQGGGETEDYDFNRNKVVTSIMPVPGTSWYLVAKTDTREAYAPLRFLAWVISLTIAILILLTGTLLGMVSASQRRDYYKKLYQMELDREALIKHYDYIVKYANDIIILHDENFNIVEVNDKTLKSYGYSREEIIGLKMENIVAPESQAQMKSRIAALDGDSGQIFETIHRNRSGKVFPVEVSLRSINIEGKTYFQGIVRDITERKEAEQRNLYLTELLDNANNSIMVYDMDGKYIYANKRTYEMHGYTKEEFVHLKLSQLDAPESAVLISSRMETLRDKGEAVFEVDHLKKDGSAIPVEVYAKKTIWNGKPVILGICNNITDRKKAEEELNTAHNQMMRQLRFNEALLEAIPTPVFYKDSEGKYIGCNRAYTEVMGVSSESMMGKTVHELWPGEMAETYHRKDLELIRQGAGLQVYEYEVVDKNKERRNVIFAKSIFRDEMGKPAGLVGAFIDITERIQMEKSLKESEDKFRSIFEHSSTGMVLTDLNGNLVQVNPAFARMLGYTREELATRPFNDITHSEDIQNSQQQFKALCQGQQEVSHFDKRYVSKSGNAVWVNINAILFKDVSGTPLYVITHALDITERKKSEKLQTILYAISQATNSTTDLAGLYEHIHQIVSELIPASNFYIALVSDDGQSLNFPYFEDEVDTHPETRPLGTGLTEYVLKTKSPLLVTPALYDEMIEHGHVSTVGTLSHNWLGVPLITGGKAIGVLVVQSYKPEEQYNDKDKDVLVYVSDHIASAIQRKQVESTLQKRQEAFGAVYHIATSLGETFQNICDRVAVDLAQILNVPHLMVQLLKDDKINVISFLSEGQMQNNLEAPLEGTPCQMVYQKGQPLEINASLRKLFPSFPLIQEYDLNAYLGVPFKDRSGKVLGLVCVFDYQTHIFSQEEIHLLDIFAHYLGYEIERVDMEHKIRETEKIKLLSSIASGVAHEVRNPLHAIQAISEAMARETDERPEYQEYLDHIRAQVKRLSLLMKELLELGKPIQPALFKKEPLKELAEAAVNYWKEAQPEMHLDLKLNNSLMPETFVFADGTKIQEVIINLLENASQHTSGHQEVTVALLPAGEKQVVVKVTDRGEGIKPQDLPRMFEPFFTTRKKGTGLGLTLCQRIIESHGGTIEISNNQEGPGCTVQFTLPLYYGE